MIVDHLIFLTYNIQYNIIYLYIYKNEFKALSVTLKLLHTPISFAFIYLLIYWVFNMYIKLWIFLLHFYLELLIALVLINNLHTGVVVVRVSLFLSHSFCVCELKLIYDFTPSQILVCCWPYSSSSSLVFHFTHISFTSSKTKIRNFLWTRKKMIGWLRKIQKSSSLDHHTFEWQ